MASVASYDVFDTVISRLIGEPRQVFVLVGQRLREAGVIAIDAEAFAAAREAALADLTQDVAVHPSLHRVMVEVAARLGLADHVPALLVDAELSAEFETCRAIPGVRAALESRRAATGRGVVFVSDTSWPQATLQTLLEREGLFQPNDQLFASAERGASKQDGRLYDLVVKELGVEPADMTHTGDDRGADLVNARVHGWKAVLDTRAHFTSRERSLLRAAVPTDGLGPRFAAASRYGRLRAIDDGLDPALASIAGGVALPLLAGFGLWTLQQAELLGLDRLYFVARDGEVFRRVTQQLAAASGSDLDCRYLHGSRKSWQLAAAGTTRYLTDGKLWLPDNTRAETLSARALLDLVGLTPSDIPAGVLDREGADEPLGARRAGALLAALTSEPVRTEISNRARLRRDLLLTYLDQQGVTSPGAVGLVDVGWTGRAARALEDTLIDGDRSLPAAHLFLGLLADAPALMGADLHGRSRGWLIDETRGRRSHTTREDPVMLVESFAMGTEGHTNGFRAQGDLVVPHLVHASNPAVSAWGFAEYRACLDSALSALVDGPPLDSGVDLRPLTWRQVLDFWRNPSRTDAAAWGKQPYGEDFANTLTHPLAAPVTTRRMLTRAGIGKPEWRQPTYWLAGSLALSGSPWRQLLQRLERVQTALPRMRRIPSRVRAEWAVRTRSA